MTYNKRKRGVIMADISKDNKRVVSIMPKDLAQQLEQIAFDNGRMSVSAYIVRLVDEDIKRKYKVGEQG
jgi:hypothetical protein